MTLKFRVGSHYEADVYVRMSDREYITITEFLENTPELTVFEGRVEWSGSRYPLFSFDEDGKRDYLDVDTPVELIMTKEGYSARCKFGDGDDRVKMGYGGGRINAGEGDNTLIGGNGYDRFSAGRGDDVYKGGSGEDRLISRGGNDTMSGGDMQDYFQFTSAETRAVITDFNVDEDSIWIRGGDWDVTYRNIRIMDHADGTLVFYKNADDKKERVEIILENVDPDDIHVMDFYLM